MEKQEKICRLCLDICNNTFKVIENNTTKILSILLECDLLIIKEAVMCANCTESFKDCYNFKLTCLDVEDFIVQFNKKGKNTKLDLKDIYRRKMANGVPEDHDVCRLCMTSLRICSFISLDNDKGDIMPEKMMLEKCLPKLDLRVTENPVICIPCRGTLLHCFHFMTNCLMVEEKIKRYCDAASIDVTDQIKLKNVVEFTTKNISRKVHRVKMKDKFCKDEELEYNDYISDDMLTNNDDVARNADTVEKKGNFLEGIEGKIELATENLKDKFCEDKELVDKHACSDELLHISENLLTNKDIVTVRKKETFLEEIGSGIEQIGFAPVYLQERFYEEKELVAEKVCSNELPCLAENTVEIEKTLLEKMRSKIKLEPEHLKEKFCEDEELVKKQEYKVELLCVPEKTPMNKGNAKKADTVAIAETLLAEIKSKIKLEHEHLNDKFCAYEDVKEQECTDELPYISENISTNEENVEEGDQQFVHESEFTIKCESDNQVPKTKQLYCQEEEYNYEIKQQNFNSLPVQDILPQTETNINLPKMEDECLLKQSHRTLQQGSFVKSGESIINKPLNLESIQKNASERKGHQCNSFLLQTKYKSCLARHKLNEKNPSQTYQCEHCSYQTNYKSTLKIHLLTHKNPSKIIMYQCKHCPFLTKYENCLTEHNLIHINLIKLYQCEHCSYTTNYKDYLQKHLLIHKNLPEVTMNQCEFCSFQAKHKRYLKKHLLTHKNPSEITMYQCELCSFQTKRKGTLKTHLLNHKNPSEITMYQCDHCSFQTKHKGNLKSHLPNHKNPSEITMYQCEHCSYRTKHKGSIKSHLLNHKNPSEIAMYQCEHCSFQTKHERYIKRHLLTHQNPSEIIMYQCEHCSFQTKRKGTLKTHLLNHKNPSEITMYQCKRCSFQTKHKGSLKRHLLSHKSPSEVTMYQCEYCSFQTKLKSNVKMHLLNHKNPLEINMYQCKHCSFQTKLKGNLTKHLLIHKSPSEVTIYQCEHCSFKSKYKTSINRHLLTHKSPPR